MCDIDEPGRKTSSASARRRRAALAIIQRSVSWVWVTPLAGPVLPEVKKIAAGSSGRRGGGQRLGRRSGRERRSSSRAPVPRPPAPAYQIVPSGEAAGERALGDVLGALDVGDERRGAADLERVVDLAGRVAVVQRRRDQPRPEAGEVVDDEVRSGSASARRSGRRARGRDRGRPRPGAALASSSSRQLVSRSAETIATCVRIGRRGRRRSRSPSGGAGASSSIPLTNIGAILDGGQP